MTALRPSHETMSDTNKPLANTNVLIVGAGPAGLLTAYLLARQGIPSVIITRYSTRLGQPKAYAINPRSLEILRQAGLDVKKLRHLGAKTSDAFWVRFNLGLTGHELGKIPYERQDDSVKDVTPEPLFNISQPILEDFLQEAALGTKLVMIRPGWEWESYELEEGKPVSLIRNRSDHSETIQFRSEYVIGADGNESTVRSAMSNVKWASPDDVDRSKRFYCSIHASGDLTKSFANRDRRGQLCFCFHPDHRAGLIIYHPTKSWVHARVIDPAEEPVESFDDSRCRELIRPCIGPDVDIEILSVNLWYTWPRVATSYSDATYRVHLVGDAAHSFPPQGGLGINTGFADAHNLGWKLGLSLRVGAEPLPLLETYTSERKPVAVANSVHSAHNEDIWHEFNIKMYDLLEKRLKGGQESDYTKLKQEFDQGLAINKRHFDSLALQIGYKYHPSSDPTAAPTDYGDYQPSSAIGARLPHAWLEDGRSTLDLVPENNFVIFHAGLGYTDKKCHFGLEEIIVTAVDVVEAGAPQSWITMMGLSPDKAILTRPDQHILAHPKTIDDIWVAMSEYLDGTVIAI